MIFFGPVFSASHGSSASWLPVLGGVVGLIIGWWHYLVHRHDEKLTMRRMLLFSFLCMAIVLAGVWGLWKPNR
jgi:hypothetical protein